MVGTIAGLIVLWLLLCCLGMIVIRDRDRANIRIAALERENLTLAKSIVAHTKRIDESQIDSQQALEIALDCQKSLTSQPEKPKLIPKTKSVNWKSFRTAIERANDPQEPA